MKFLRNLFDNNEKDIRKYRAVVDKINALEPEIQKLTNAQLRAKTDEFRAHVQSEWAKRVAALEAGGLLESERKDKTRKALDDVLDAILPQAFAVVREAGRRAIGQRHYDVQLIGGMVTHDGRIAELKTGEGKTLMATLPLYLNALAGRGAHLVTANDYLSKVGAVWMGPIYTLLGMSVGIIQGQSPETGDLGGSYIYDPDYIDPDPRYTYCRTCTRAEAYACDVTYGTNNEYGFDYLRDNMAFDKEDLVMRDLHFAIVDEVDSILIDEARTPLIISGMVNEDTSKYAEIDRAVRNLRAGKEAKTQQEREDPEHDRNNPDIDYLVDEKQKTIALTEHGTHRIERNLGIANLADDPQKMHYVTAAIKAHALFKKDVDYVIKDGEIVIVDEFTGRLMFGRRYSDGLHQAIEAKEGLEIKHESQTVATITFQNLFRLYLKLAGMTGTAKTEEDEFRKIYGLDVVMVPTNRPMQRKDQPDIIYKVQEHKFRGIAEEILRLWIKQQPVLVGTRSIEMSERVSGAISARSLQTMCEVALIRHKMEANKLPKDRKEQITEILNGPLAQLSPAKLAPLAREVGIDPDPLKESNLQEVLRLLNYQGTPEQLDLIEEALSHGIPHNVLNAKYHEKEAVIIAEAGRKGAITIATNMAGRGVDILLGGRPEDLQLPDEQDKTAETPTETHASDETADSHHAAEALPDFRRGGRSTVLESVTTLTPDEHRKAADEVRALGGLYILGTERHESRRIDNQLRGRAGRQGDPGESRFFVSLEDELWRLFGDRANHPLLKGWPDHEMMDQAFLSKMIERAQRKVEEHHFESRKMVLQYDDVMNKQREVIYAERRAILEGANLRDTIVSFLRNTVADSVNIFCPAAETGEAWDLEGLYSGLSEYFPIEEYLSIDALETKDRTALTQQLIEAVEQAYADKEQQIAAVAGGDIEAMRQLERNVALYAVNNKWMEHLANMDYLREGIGLRGYAQQDPLVVYQKEAFEMFENMQHAIQDEIARYMFHLQPVLQQPEIEMETHPQTYNDWVNLDDGGGTFPGLPQAPSPEPPAPKRQAAPSRKPGRNDPCWCGSGKKYKQCHYPD
jgi:preprotein translocase subunit SecA